MALQFACEAFAPTGALECDCDIPDGVTILSIIEAASDAVTLLTDGAVRGRCTALFRPVADNAWCGIYGPVEPYIVLPGPNTAVNHVKIDGDTLATSEYKLIDGNKLYRVTGSWPAHQNFLLDSTEANTFEVSVSSGWPVSLIVRSATLQLACEIVSHLSGNRTFIPANAVSANMDGLTLDLDALASAAGAQPMMKQVLEVYGFQHGIFDIGSPELNGGWVLHW